MNFNTINYGILPGRAGKEGHVMVVILLSLRSGPRPGLGPGTVILGFKRS